MPRPLAVLFDLDGTLVDTLELLLSSARAAFRDRPDRAPTEAEWKAGIGTPLVRQLEPWAVDAGELEYLTSCYRAHQREHHDRLTRLYPGAAEAVRALHEAGHPLGVVTSKGNEIAHRTLRHVGLAGLMQAVVGVESCTRYKPDPEPVHVALAQLGYTPGEAVFVGDSPHDMQSGAAAGVTTVAALWGFFTPEALDGTGADHFLDAPSEIPGLIARLEDQRA